MVERKPKVLSLILSFKLGGIAISSLRFIRSTQDDFEHFVVGRKISNDQDLMVLEDFKKFSRECYDIDVSRFRFVSVYQLIKVVWNVKPEIIHVHSKGGALYGVFIKLLYWRKFKLFYTTHGFYITYTGVFHRLHMVFERVINKLSTKTITVSKSERSFYLQTTKCPPQKTIIIPNGVEVEKKQLPNSLAEVLSKYSVNIVSLSRIDPAKDLVTMLKVFDNLEAKSVALHIIGGYVFDKPSQRDYKDKVDALLSLSKKKNDIFFWGDVPFAGNFLHSFQLYWSTSISEGLPTGIIEAMLSRLLVIGTNCRGNVDLIEEKETGFLTPMEDVITITEKLYEAIDSLNEELSKRIIENAYKKAQDYGIIRSSMKLAGLYLE